MGNGSSTSKERTSAKLLEIVKSTTAARRDSSSSSRRNVTECVSITKEAVATLKESFPSSTPLNLITIWGPARTGKSFFMNSLLAPECDINTAAEANNTSNSNSNNGDNGDVFVAAGGSDPCTVGAFISTTTRTLSQISSAQAREMPQQDTQDCPPEDNRTPTPPQQPASSGEGSSWWWWGGGGSSSKKPLGEGSPRQQLPEIGFVDVEGQGDRHHSYETKLMTPLLLLSKVVIYNWKGLPSKATILDQLSALTYAATLLSPPQRKNALGHLIILLRDVSETQQQNAYNLIFEPEDEGGAEARAGGGVKARNEKRALLKLSFQSIRVCCLPSPHPEIDHEREIPQAEVTTEFKQEVCKLRRALATEMLVKPHHFGDRPIEGGHALAMLLPEVCKEVNQGSKNLIPLSMMESVHQGRAEEVYLEAKELFYNALSKSNVDMPHSQAAMTKLLQKGRSTAEGYYNRETQILAQVAIDRGMASLQCAIERRSEASHCLQKSQVAAARRKIVRLVYQAQNQGVDEKVAEITPSLPMTRERQVKSAFNGICKKLHGKLKTDITKVDGYKDLRADLPPLLTLAKFTKDVQGKLDALLIENRHQTALRREEERKEALRQKLKLQQERAARLEAERQREEEKADEEWEAWARQRSYTLSRSNSSDDTYRHGSDSDDDRRREDMRYAAFMPRNERARREQERRDRQERVEELAEGMRAFGSLARGAGYLISTAWSNRDEETEEMAGASSAEDVEVGDIFNHDHAGILAREYESAHPNKKWTGHWKTPYIRVCDRR